jgi:peroxiredoxin
MLLALGVSNVLLLRQNLQLRARLAAAAPQPEALRPGDKVPGFVAAGLRGETVEVEYAGAGTKRILLYFTPTCPYCREQFAYWREIIGRADPNQFEVIGVARDAEDKSKLEDYLRAVNCAGDSQTPLRVALNPEAVRRAYKFSATPITVIVANDGTVEKHWAGRWDAQGLADAGSIFGFAFSHNLSARQSAPGR